MKSVEVLFNESLAELKKKASATTYEKTSAEYLKLPTIEAKLNCVLAALESLKESANFLNLEDIEESKRDYAVLFGVEPRQKTNNKEAAAPIVKHNGRSDNFSESNPLQRADGAPVQMTETNAQKDMCAKGDKVLADGLLKLGKITESEHRKITGQKPEGYAQLTEKQRKEFDHAKLFGFSESDCFKLAYMVGSNLREVSR